MKKFLKTFIFAICLILPTIFCLTACGGEKATINYSESDIVWSASELTYDGTEKTVTITNLPNTLKAEYGNNAKTDAGEYTATVTISAVDSDNYSFEEITVEHTWKIKAKKLSDLKLFITDFKYDKNTGRYICEKTLSANDGVVNGDNVTLTIMACRSACPANGIYELWYNIDMQGEADVIACNNDNYTFENGEHGCGKAYVSDKFDINGGITVELSRETYYVIELELDANTSMKYRFNLSNDNISFSLKDENLNEISYNDGFTLTNDTDSAKTFVVYMIVSGQGTITMYNHRAVLMDGESEYQKLYVLDGYDISNIESTKAYYDFGGWYTTNDKKVTTITGDVTLYAKLTPIVYTITYQDTFGLENVNPATYTIEDGEITLKPLADRVDYTFRYWERVYDSPYQTDPYSTTAISVSKHKGNLTLKAVWDKKTEYDAFEYTVSEDCTKATITGLKNTSSTSITIPKGVVAIGNNAFKDCSLLATVNFEDSTNALTIGDYAFSGCKSLSSITIPARVTEIGNNAFERSGLIEINFSENGNLTTLGNSVFYNCEGLTEVTIPDSVVSMGRYVFSSCIRLTKIVFGKGMTVIGEEVYGGSSVLREIEFKGEITSFHKNAFQQIATENITLTLNMNQKNLKQVAYRNNNGGTDYSDDYFAESGFYRVVGTTTTFCGYTFSEICLSCDATEMTAKEFSSKLESGINTAFTNLKFILPPSADNYFSAIRTFISKYAEGSVTLTIEGATSIPAEAFYTDGVGIQLKEVIIGDSVTSIGGDAFSCCYCLQKVTFGKKLTTLGKFAFYNCEELTEIEIPNSVTSIGNNCFDNCIKLESVKLSSSITVLNDNVFAGCTSLKSLIISDGVTEIRSEALQSCENLESIVIPKSITTIDNATYACKALTKVYYAGTASEWQSISIVCGDNDPLKTATIYYYSESEPTTGNYWHYENGVPTAW